VAIMSKARHRGAATYHVSVVGELPTHGAAEGEVVRKIAGVPYPLHEFMLVGDLGIGVGGERRGGGPGVGCARMSVGTYLYLHAVGAGNHVAVPCLARQGAKRVTGSCDPRDPREALH
jgi:hypothetical protein